MTWTAADVEIILMLLIFAALTVFVEVKGWRK